jgi:YihY family inner membrane protein
VALSAIKGVGTRAKLEVEKARARYDVVDIAVQTFKRHSEDDGGFYAAALTYFTFFSIFPILLFATAALGYASFLSEGMRGDLLEAGKGTFPLIRRFLQPRNLASIEEHRGALALTGLGLALYSGSGAVAALQHALNRIYRIPDRTSALARRLNAVRWLAMFGTITLISVALGGIGALLPGPFQTVLTFFGSFAVTLLLFTTAFRFLPNRTRCPWRDVLPGAVVATVVFESLKIFGAIYAWVSEGRTTTFGVVFVTAAALLVASYVLSQVTLLAAELNAVVAERRITRDFSLADKTEAEEGL